MKRLILLALFVGSLSNAGIVKIAVKTVAAAPKVTYHAAKKTVKIAAKVLY